MNDGTKQGRTILIVVLCIVAVALAAWSGIRAFSNRGRTIGHMGTISAQSELSPKEPEAKATGGKDLSGAPAAASQAGGQGP